MFTLGSVFRKRGRAERSVGGLFLSTMCSDARLTRSTAGPLPELKDRDARQRGSRRRSEAVRNKPSSWIWRPKRPRCDQRSAWRNSTGWPWSWEQQGNSSSGSWMPPWCWQLMCWPECLGAAWSGDISIWCCPVWSLLAPCWISGCQSTASLPTATITCTGEGPDDLVPSTCC